MKSVRIGNFSGPYFSCIRTEYGPEKLRIRTFFTQFISLIWPGTLQEINNFMLEINQINRAIKNFVSPIQKIM